MKCVPKLFSKPCGFGAALLTSPHLGWDRHQSQTDADQSREGSSKNSPAGVGQLIESLNEFSAYLDAESEFTQVYLSEYFRRKDSRLSKSFKQMDTSC